MKKIFVFLLLAIFITSCKDDDDENLDPSLYGTWAGKQSDTRLTFSSDGILKTEIITGTSHITVTTEYEREYQAKGNKIYVATLDGKTTSSVWSYTITNGNILTITLQHADNGTTHANISGRYEKITK